MIYSNDRKLALSGWLKEHNPSSYNSSLKLQKFLLFYELFSYVNDEPADFFSLKGYKKGPVFSAVWGDYTKEHEEFIKKSQEVYLKNRATINSSYAKRSSFLTSILSESELSKLTHALNLWQSKERRILTGEKQVPLDKKDFIRSDKELICKLESLYPDDLIDNVIIEHIDNKSFLIPKDKVCEFTAEHMDVLMQIAESQELYNPVYVDIADDGGLIID